MSNMFKNTIAVLTIGFMVFTLGSCKTTKETNVEENVTEAVVEEAEVVPAEEYPTDPAIERNFFASIERSPCFGKCPTYKMTLYSDGFVEFEGIRDVAMIGTYTTTISDKKLKNFEIQARAIGFMEMEDKYDGAISDVPSATIVMFLDNTRKQVYRRFEYPKRILILEQCFDDLMTSERWISSDGEIYPSEK